MLEILAPAGNEACANAAINNGADAIYLGLSAFSARQSAENFDEAAFRRLILKAHCLGVKVYVAMNTLVKDEEISAFFSNLLFAWNMGADAIIMQDLLLGKLVHELYPQIVLHASTQAGICTVEGAQFAKECGFSRVILARETPISEIQQIAQLIETEVFVQGALCTCFSGQCYFSSFAGGNSGNRGRCKQPCRKLYAYNRNGNQEKTYALSLSDLCVGEDIQKLIAAGVTSFKIEGRMRREEYVAAAVSYYRGILDGAQSLNARLSDLKRTYNRGNYTKGLAFGQDKRFLSTAVQGHLGEKVGVVKVVNGEYLVESSFQPRQGDAFKILRDGKEVGGAIYTKTVRKAFIISSKNRLKNGDGVFITTDVEVNERVLKTERRGRLTISLRFVEGEKPIAIFGDKQFVGENALQTAQNQPLTIEQLKTCFSKTDGLPLDVDFADIILLGNIFIPKSELNAFRRAFYAEICEEIAVGGREIYQEKPCEIPAVSPLQTRKTAVIANDFNDVETDVAIFKPNDFSTPLPDSFKSGKFEKYLYFPAFATRADILAIEEYLKQTDICGIYAENYGGVLFARKRGLQIFAGTGLNITNKYSLFVFLRGARLSYYAISKELNETEMQNLLGEGAFTLSLGNIKIMDLCYCPFGKTCGACDKREKYTLTDENGRVFSVRRYLSADGNCRFEVFNCADLIGVGAKGAGQLIDLSVTADCQAAIQTKDDEEKQKQVYANYTSGHFKRGVL
ncbi:MAG: U32 family peptidase [Clostridia bacterium]|nr:U32 family peptidase [Clostridia bacterium]